MVLKFKSIFRGDAQLWAIFFALLTISFLEVFSATSTLAYEKGIFEPILAHSKFIILSIGIVWGLSRCPVKLFRAGVLLYVIGIVFQIIALAKGEEINEAARWVTLFGQRFQPSEIVKPGLVFLGAAIYTSKSWGSPERRFWWYFGLMTFPIILVGYDNLSTGLILTCFVFLFAWFCDAPIRAMFKALGAVVILGAIGGILLVTLPASTLQKIHPRSPTWQSRLMDKKDSSSINAKQTDIISATELQRADTLAQMEAKDPTKFRFTKENFQPANAKIAIARSKGIGVGPGHSVQRDILPQAYSDYIYATTIEEYGIIGMLCLPLIFLWFYLRLSKLASRTQDLYSRYLLLGFGALYMMQALINLAVAAGVFPVTGQTLPLVSRGGTSFIFTSIAYGVIIGISNNIAPKNFAQKINKEMENEQTELDLQEVTPEDEEISLARRKGELSK